MSSDQPDDASGCERDDALDPHINPPGLDTLGYRVGDHGRFLARMRGWISRQGADPNDPRAVARPLAALTTRAADDPVLGLIDAWACTLDVLTFYQERIANEGFLRTAGERRSVLELARAIGYELAPGQAASTRLAFTLLDTKHAPEVVDLAVGLQVMSVPGSGELPQIFETVEAVRARPQWNAMAPSKRLAPGLGRGDRQLWLAGLSTGLRPGQRLLIVGRRRREDAGARDWVLRTVIAVDLDKSAVVTRVDLDQALDWEAPGELEAPQVFAFSRRLELFGRAAPDPRLYADELKLGMIDAGLLAAPVIGGGESEGEGEGEGLGGQGQSEGVPDLARVEWAHFTVFEPGGDGPRLHLVGAIEGLVPGGWLVLEGEGQAAPVGIVAVASSGRADFSLVLDTTRVTLDAAPALAGSSLRTVAVHGVSRALALGTRPLEVDVAGAVIELAGELPALEVGRAVIVSGPEPGVDPSLRREDPALAIQAEVGFVAAMTAQAGTTVLELSAPLSRAYDRARTLIFANVARATHGKTVAEEVLGSGDGSKRFQRFALRQHPVTHVADKTGAATTLRVHVGGVAWTEVPSTHGLGPDDRVYVARVDDDGVTTIAFGDGRSGARLPTGSENVRAGYRAGLGRDGEVARGKLTVLRTRPQGVKAVDNPLPAAGAEDPETLADARQNAPITVLTLDRLVSVSDYQDFARAYPGVGKAQAARLWDGRRWWVHLSLANSAGDPVQAGDDLYLSLRADIDARRDPMQRLLFAGFAPRSFRLRGKLHVDPAHVAKTVIAAAVAGLRAGFDFSRRGFGQAVTGAEILAGIHRIPGVVAVDLDALWRDDQPPPKDPVAPERWVLPAAAARWEPRTGAVSPAELLLLDADAEAITLEEVRP